MSFLQYCRKDTNNKHRQETLVYINGNLVEGIGFIMRAPSKAKAIKLVNPAQVKSNQQPGTELHMLGGNK